MNKIIVKWIAYPLDKTGARHRLSGSVEVTPWVQYRKVLEEARERVYQEYPMLRSTPINVIR
jgi:hypothetical protein